MRLESHQHSSSLPYRAVVGICLLFICCSYGQAGEDTMSAAREATSWATPGRWQAFPSNPVLAPGPAGSWDAGALGSMTVLKVGNQLHMYYEA